MGIAVKKCQANTNGLVMAAISVTFRHTRFIEGRHLGENFDRGQDEPHPQASPCPLPQPEIQIEERLQSQTFQSRLMPPFDRSVRRNQVLS